MVGIVVPLLAVLVSRTGVMGQVLTSSILIQLPVNILKRQWKMTQVLGPLSSL